MSPDEYLDTVTPGDLQELIAAEVLDDRDREEFQERLLWTLGMGFAVLSSQPYEPGDFVVQTGKRKRKPPRAASVAQQRAILVQASLGRIEQV